MWIGLTNRGTNPRMAELTYDFSGRVALITGAASGVGLDTARLLAGAGAKVALLDLSQDALDEALGGVDGDAIEIGRAHV